MLATIYDLENKIITFDFQIFNQSNRIVPNSYESRKDT